MQIRNRALTSMAFLLCLGTAADATATAQRTFVASHGNDANPCSIAQPCRSFAAAIAKTSPSGEIIVLDSAGYGPVSISQSVSIIAPPGIYAGITVFNTEGVYINNGSVVLRGLTITGQGTDPETNGIFVFDATEVHIESCEISNLSDSGIQIYPGVGQPKVFIKDTVLRSNGTKGLFLGNGDATEVYVQDTVISRNGYAFHAEPAGIAVFAGSATLDRVRIENNFGHGAVIRADSSAALRNLTFRDGVISGNDLLGLEAEAGGGGNANFVIDHSIVERNGGGGVETEGSGPVTGTISNTTLTNNADNAVHVLGSSVGTAVVVSGNTITRNSGCGLKNESAGGLGSRGDNTIAANGCVTSGSITPLGGF